MNAGSKKVITASEHLGGGIAGALRNTLEIKSPSRVMMGVAHRTGEGLIVGLKDMEKPVKKVAEGLGEKTVSSLQSSFSRIADIIDLDMDMSPTIRPVIDMSDVQKGIDGAFSKSRIISGIGVRTTNLANQNASAIKSRTNPMSSIIDDVVKLVSGNNGTSKRCFYNTKILLIFRVPTQKK